MMVKCWLLCERTLFVIHRGFEENYNCDGFEVRDGEVLAIAWARDKDGEVMQNNYRERGDH